MPAIMLTPDSGLPNTTVTVIGTGWASGETVTIEMQTVTIVPPGVAVASSNGFFETTFVVPAFAAGPVTVAAFGSSNVTSATAPFTVLSPPPKATLTATLSSPGSATVGGTLLYTLNVYVNGTSYSVPLSDISGSILQPNGVTVPMSFLSVGTGVYQYLYHVPNITGTYVATVTVTYDGLTYTTSATFYATSTITTTTTAPPTVPAALNQTLSSIISAEGALQSALTSLQSALSSLSSQVQAELTAFASSFASLASSVSALRSQIGTSTDYSLGALVIAFIALIVIIYGVFVRRMP
jgi:hypothetical protein